MKKLLIALLFSLSFATFGAFAAVDLNTASQTELESVKGIGPKKAQAIIEYRQKNGLFKSVDELDNVPGFGKKTVDLVKKDLTVSGGTKAANSAKPADSKAVKEKK
ncbi:MAG: helix-hairpin-helix domain-containing protein [Methylobacillus sp.]|jgi:competence protein ComEA|nr:helix-hairpin-helix domain-containing protein [Methylobacillus sp.]